MTHFIHLTLRLVQIFKAFQVATCASRVAICISFIAPSPPVPLAFFVLVCTPAALFAWETSPTPPGEAAPAAAGFFGAKPPAHLRACLPRWSPGTASSDLEVTKASRAPCRSRTGTSHQDGDPAGKPVTQPRQHKHRQKSAPCEVLSLGGCCSHPEPPRPAGAVPRPLLLSPPGVCLWG